MEKLIKIGCLFLLFSCEKEVNPKKNETLGLWGGVGVQLNITENNTNFEFDCATANLNSKLKAVDNKIVELFGTYTYEHGGPIKVDEKVDVHLAKFRGEIIGDSMKIYITILDQKRADILLNMKRNEKGIIFKCL